MYPPAPKIQTVSELTSSIRGLLELSFPFVTVAGEITNLRCPHSGHLYFTLKDRQSQIKAVLFKTQQRYLEQGPADGMEVVCRGRISLYEARGEYQLVVDMLAPKGTGALQLSFELLKNRLALEGLFAEERKKSLPLLPEKIALITSPSGAAIHDFLTTARQRCPSVPIEIYPVRVQGSGADLEVAEAIKLANQRGENDVIVLCRGGGSLEDLWTFNEETVARAVAASAIPVVTGIGHEIDLSIADLVADLRAATPTAAAQAVLPDREQLCQLISSLAGRLTRKTRERLVFLKQKTAACRSTLGDPGSIISQFSLRTERNLSSLRFAFQQSLQKRRLALNLCEKTLAGNDPKHRLHSLQRTSSELESRLFRALRENLLSRKMALGNNAALLQALSPLAVLSRGYALSRREDGAIIRDSAELNPGEKLILTLAKGEIDCEVLKIRS